MPEQNGAQARPYPGRLIVIEGIDGAGKSTQAALLRAWLEGQGYVVVHSRWNSAPAVRPLTRRAKRERLFTPLTFSLVHAADLANRLHARIVPALAAGAVVVSDRYCPTAYARDAARGVDGEWLRRLFAFAPRADLTILLRLPAEEAAVRLLAGNRKVSFYEAGADLGLHADRARSLQLFLERLVEEYDRLADDDEIHLLDATQPVPEIQRQIRALVSPLLDGRLLRRPAESLAAVLAAYGLRGRHVLAEARGGGGEDDA
jgi:dTMP kinase